MTGDAHRERTAPSEGQDDGGLEPGHEFAGHRIEAEVGRGGMGVVYRARNLMLDRDRALKVITPAVSADPRFRERLRRESRLAASIEHPNVIPVHHAGEEAGRLYIAMRLVEGVDLRRELEASGPLDPARVAAIVRQVAAGLDAAHRAGLVHRDVKPANILLEAAEGDERVFVTDFGISRMAAGGETATASGELLGSPDYAAPEQIEGGAVDVRTDLYSLGATLHFALTGSPPFPREGEMAKLYAHGHAPRPRPSELAEWLPARIDGVVAKAMAIDPAGRYGSAGELAAAAEEALTGAGAPPPRRSGAGPGEPALTAPTRVLRRRPRAIRGLIALGLLAIVGAGAALLLGGGGDPGPTATGNGQPRPIATIPVGQGPNGITVGAGRAWVASRDEGVVDAIDAATDRRLASPVPVDGSPISVEAGFGSIWAVIAGRGGQVLRHDPDGDAAAVSIDVGPSPSDVAVDDRWVWVANEGNDTVTRIDPSSNRVDAEVPVGDGPRSITAGEGAVWVTNIGAGSLTKIDPDRARTVGKPVAVGQRPSDVAVGADYVWAMDNFAGTVTRVDPERLEVVGDPIEVGAKPRGVKVAFGYVWIANGGDGTVTRIDPASAEEVPPAVTVGANPADIAVGARSVWTTNFDDATVTRIEP